MAEYLDSVTSGVRRLAKLTKNVVLQTSEAEAKVKDATTNDKWGPTATQMRELTQMTFSDDSLLLVMNALLKRLSEPGKLWRHVYKSLLVIDYMLKNGSDEVANFCREHIIEIQTLTHFQHVDETDQKDQGINVRERAKVVLELLHDEQKLADERKRSSAARSKYVGVSNEDASMLKQNASGDGDSRWGMSANEDYDYHHGYSTPADQSAKLGSNQKPAQTTTSTTKPVTEATTATTTTTQTRQTSLIDITPDPTTTTTTQQTPSISLFGALSGNPNTTTNTNTNVVRPVQSANDMFDPRGNAQNTNTQTSFFPPATPVQTTQTFDPFNMSSIPTTTTTTFTTTPIVQTQQQQQQHTQGGFGVGAFGDFEEAKPTTNTTTTTTPNSSGARDLWNAGLVNLDSIGTTSATKKVGGSGANANTKSNDPNKRLPMAAITATGPAMRASATTAPALTPTQMTGTGPNYNVLRPQQPPMGIMPMGQQQMGMPMGMGMSGQQQMFYGQPPQQQRPFM